MLIPTLIAASLACPSSPSPQDVEFQPLAANVRRVVSAMEFLGTPFSREDLVAIEKAVAGGDAAVLQREIDKRVLLSVHINPELRVKVARGTAAAGAQQGGYTPFLVKVTNEGTTTRALEIVSPQAGLSYSGESLGILKRQAQTELKSDGKPVPKDRVLHVEMFNDPPMTRSLSGLEVEYLIALVHSEQSGKREATIGFDLGAGNQDLGFRGETPVLFDFRKAVSVPLVIRDDNGQPTTARLTFRDSRGRVYPPQARRKAPDFFFQPQIYRADGTTVSLPPGEYELESSRGPEYLVRKQKVTVSHDVPQPVEVKLNRWVAPMEHGYFSGDHHIHGAGCSHYTSPTEGVTPENMFLQVKGEGLNVGCVLTWGPCFDFQRQYFAPKAKTLSEALTVLKYDLEISGFGSAALGHVCLLNLKDQTYPGSNGSSKTGWPTWTVPVMKWAKDQGGFTGYPHSAMNCIPKNAAARLLEKHDADGDGVLSAAEADNALLPRHFRAIDRDTSGRLDAVELTAAHEHAVHQIPNHAIPEMDGAGAMEIFVSAAEGVCDFISAMDTARVSEWNTWYHLMNCGLPIKLSGETDFPCMSSRRVGQGRVYVKLGSVESVDFKTWCEQLAGGSSYVSDGYIHAFNFTVETGGRRAEPGGPALTSTTPTNITATASIQIAAETPEAVAYGTQKPPRGRAATGDTVILHQPRNSRVVRGGNRLIELVVNGKVVATREVPADGQPHDIEFTTDIARSSWVAVRQFPQMHTNPVNVLISDQPIRASRASAQWCIDCIELLWKKRRRFISGNEQPAARAAYDRALKRYQTIKSESAAGA